MLSFGVQKNPVPSWWEWFLCCPFLLWRAAVTKESKERNKPENYLLCSSFCVIPRSLIFFVPTFQNTLSSRQYSDVRESPKRKNTTFTTRWKIEIWIWFVAGAVGRPWSVLTRFRSGGPKGHNTKLYYSSHVFLMAFQNVLCLNVRVHLPASFLTSLCPPLFIHISFHSYFLLFFISHFPFLLSLCFLYSFSLIYFSVLLLLFYPAFLPWFCVYFTRLSLYPFCLSFVFAKYLPRFIKFQHNRIRTYNCTLV